MLKARYFLLSLSLVIGALVAEEKFVPKVTIKNESSKTLYVYSLHANDVQDGGLFKIPDRYTFILEPKTGAITYDILPAMVYVSSDDSRNLKTLWPVIDYTKKTYDDCWYNLPINSDEELRQIGAVWNYGLYREAPCTNPLIYNKFINKGIENGQDIVAYISDGRSQEFAAGIYRVFRGGAWAEFKYNIRLFFNQLFGRSQPK
jgi:hypothetical protein